MNIIKQITKYKIVILLTLLLASLISCEDAYNIDPNGQLTEDIAFLNVDDLQKGLNGAFGLYSPENAVRFNAVFSDNVKIGVDNGGQLVPLYNWKLTAGEGNAASIWNSNYFMLNRINRVLKASTKITPSVNELEDYNNILGQLHALRALAHYDLLTYYTTNYEDMNALAAIISDFVPADVNTVYSRNTNGEFYTFIKEELDLANSLLSDTFVSNKFLTKDFIIGLRARVALTKGEYTNAIDYANQLIVKYSLADTNQYTSMFIDGDTTEVILSIARFGGSFGGIFYFTNSAGPMWEVSNSLYNTLDINDVRRNVLVNFTPDRNGPSVPADNYILINKYPGPSPQFVNNFKAMRISEMYLIKAESEAQQNSLILAAQTLKTLRDARYGTSTTVDNYANKTQAIDALLAERRKELAFEGSRYLDLKRTKRDISRDAIDCASGGNCFLPSNDFKFTLPIAQVEINANPNITQNPGY